MRRMIFTGIAAAVVMAGSVWAQGITMPQGTDGTSGAVRDLGGGVQSFPFTSPQDRSRFGAIDPFGPTRNPPPGSSPSFPPAGLTPGPLVPFTPHGPLMPQVVIPPSGGGVSGFGK